MFSIIIALLFCYTLMQAIFMLLSLGKPKNLPPGPAPLPIIGNLHQLGKNPHPSLAELAKIHGPIMFLKLGRINTLVISSATAAKMVLQKQDLAFSNRFVSDVLHVHNHFQESVVWLPIEAKWRSLRKILNSNIFSGKRLDNGINKQLRSQKVQELIAYCQHASESGDFIDIGRVAFRTTFNIISNTIFSRDLIHADQDSGKEFKEVVWNIMELAGKPNLVYFFPVLKRIDPQGIRRRMTENFGKVFEIFEGLINERIELRKSKHGVQGERDDILEILLNDSQQKHEEINLSLIKSLCLDLFVAGTDTSSGTLEWAMTEVLANPHIMAKAKDELSQVIGKGKIIEEKDVVRLPYLQNIVKETLRIHAPAPLLIPWKLQHQIELNGYMIPKGTQVFVNAWAIGHDLTLWQDPLDFKPERFSISGIDVQGSDFELIPFGGGRRICPGLPLAMCMIPMMLGSLLNNFDWKLESGIGSNELDLTEKFGLTLQKAEPLRAIPVRAA